MICEPAASGSATQQVELPPFAAAIEAGVAAVGCCFDVIDPDNRRPGTPLCDGSAS